MGDELVWDAHESSNPYTAFAIQGSLAPPKMTKDTDKEIRNRCKSVVLGTNDGMSAYGVAQATEIHEPEAKALLHKRRETYHKFWSRLKTAMTVDCLASSWKPASVGPFE